MAFVGRIAREASPGVPRLEAACILGLSNRLRVLTSGLAVAEATGRSFRMLWPVTVACAARFADLFETHPAVREADVADVADFPDWSGREVPRRPGPFADPAADYRACTFVWLYTGLPPETRAPLERRSAELLDRLRPRPAIGAAVERFAGRHFGPSTIGVHLRRGDMLARRPDAAANLAAALMAVDGALDQRPEAAIFLATDDGAVHPETGQARAEGVRERFIARYGRRVAQFQPRSLDRRTPEAIQDALVELLLLRRTDHLVGTAGSSFTELATFGRPVPLTVCAGADEARARLLARWERLGLARLLEATGRILYGEPLPAFHAWQLLKHLPHRSAARLAELVAPGLHRRRRLAMLERLAVRPGR